MLRFILRRLIQMVGVILVLSVLVFVWLRSLPGGPVSALLGERGTPARRAALEKALGLDQPLPVQYLRYMERAFQGDFGVSTKVLPGEDAARHLLRPAAGDAGAVLLRPRPRHRPRHPAGLLRGPAQGHGASTTPRSSSRSWASRCRSSSPGFLLKYFFAVEWNLLPVSGRQSTGLDATRITGLFVLDGILTREWDAAWDALKHLILPAVALATIPFAVIFRITRASVLDVLDEDYVRTAEAKGLTAQVIRGRHVLRNAMLPVVTTVGLQVGGLLAGAILTETVFSIRGIGDALAMAFRDKDYPVLQVLIIAAAAIYVLVNLLRRHRLRRHRPPDQDEVSEHERPDPRSPRPERTSYADRRKERIDALASASADEEGGVSLILSAWRRLRRNPVFLDRPGDHRRASSCWRWSRRGWRRGTRLRVRSSTRCGRSPTRSPAPRRATCSAPTTRAATSCRACSSGQPADPAGRRARHVLRPPRRTRPRDAGRGVRRLDRLAGHAHRRRDAVHPVPAAGLQPRGAGHASPASGR